YLYGLKYTVLRYANIYGPRQDAQGEGGVISIFATKLLDGQRPVIFGDGEQTRDFVYVEDVAAANVKALSGADNMILNVGTGEPISINKLLAVMAEVIDSGIQPIHAEDRQGDIKHSCMETGRIKEYLGWAPAFSLAEGLAKTMEFYKNNQI
ncbi:MAG TPA: NAD-dependent epimerase/dehydratase family protein, partial [Desulfobacteria bacterium]|nr:NAD-dependent epimerase/dehydratase family protein [Desulfobacteria bacterium]